MDKTLLVDLWGACKSIDSAKETGVEHFIMVSSIGADNPDLGPLHIRPYLVAKRFADEYLINSGLRYTILRPSRLTDEIGSGLVTAIRPKDPDEQFISREDIASAINHCLNNKSVIGKIYELYKGQEKIESALTKNEGCSKFFFWIYTKFCTVKVTQFSSMAVNLENLSVNLAKKI